MAQAQINVQTQNGSRTVVAHRGASSYLPEHSLACYALAHAQGADYIEPDVVLTKDGVLICLHDLYLESTTDVAARYPDRKRADGHYYAADLTLAEIKTLNVFGRVPEAERAQIKGHQIATLEELILLVQRLNAKTHRSTGLLVETKAPGFHRKEQHPLEAPLLEILTKYGYTEPDSGVIIQSFEGDHLQLLRQEYKTRLPLMFLTSTLPSLESVDTMAPWANGINPARGALEKDNKITPDATALLRRMKEKGLRMFVWTFNADDNDIRRFLYEYGVDGIITNNPDAGVRVVRTSAGQTAL